jgi:metallo-beta-lactamase family protein
MESTYGNRYHKKDVNHVDSLARIIQETLDRQGNVVIPAFAVGRTQELLYLIRHIKEERLVTGHDSFEVYVDSPLAVEATHVFKDNMLECYDGETKALVERGINPIDFPGLKLSITSEESKNINFDMTPKVIISAAGMCDAGRIRHHLKHNLWRKECTILFVGYQAVGTLGRKLVESKPESVRLFGENVEVNARIEVLAGISGHADMNGLLNWIDGFKEKPSHIFVVHGEDSVTDSFAATITDRFGIPAFAPYSGGCVDLATDTILSEGIRLPKKAVEKPVKARALTAFNRVVAAAKHLMDVVLKNEGLANKDLAKFESQIQNLADKWDRDDR